MNVITKDYRQAMASMFIKSLEEKELDWSKQWKSTNANLIAPVNALTNKKYHGINQFYLMLVAMDKGYSDNRWATFNQIKSKGWKLMKDSQGHKVEYWTPYDREERKSITWEEFNQRTDKENLLLTAKYYTVFNGDNIDGIPELQKNQVEETKNDITQDELIDKLSNNMKVQIKHDGGNRAFYRPSEDKIHLPLPETFFNDYGYNSVVLHELSHATGHPNRLNRDMMNMFGSNNYAFEELIAEISSCFMSANLKFEQDDSHKDNHKAYIQSWIEAVRNKPETLIKAIKEAEKTANYMEYKAELITEQEYNKSLSSSIEITQKSVPDEKEKSLLKAIKAKGNESKKDEKSSPTKKTELEIA